MNFPPPIIRQRTPGAGYHDWTLAAAAATLALLLAGNAVQAQSAARAQPAAQVPAAAPAGAEEIRDIRGPKPLGGDWTIPVMLLAGLVTGAAAYGTWLWSRRRGRGVPSPLDVALGRLAAAQRLIGTASAREFSIEVSAVVREYIERQFHEQAVHRTTDEFLHDLVHTSHRALAAHRGNLAGFLETCDLAKFGGWKLSAEEMETLRAGAVLFVTESASPASDPTTNQGTLTPIDAAKPTGEPLAATFPPNTARNSHVAFPST